MNRTCIYSTWEKAKIDPPDQNETGETGEIELEEKLSASRKKIRSLQQQVRRKNKKIKSPGVITDLKEKSLILSDALNILEQSFSCLTCYIIKNHFMNQDRNPNGFRHNEEAKKFAVSLHFRCLWVAT